MNLNHFAMMLTYLGDTYKHQPKSRKNQDIYLGNNGEVVKVNIHSGALQSISYGTLEHTKHRADGPAWRQFKNGTLTMEMYFLNNLQHRELADGPAVIHYATNKHDQNLLSIRARSYYVYGSFVSISALTTFGFAAQPLHEQVQFKM